MSEDNKKDGEEIEDMEKKIRPETLSEDSFEDSN